MTTEQEPLQDGQAPSQPAGAAPNDPNQPVVSAAAYQPTQPASSPVAMPGADGAGVPYLTPAEMPKSKTKAPLIIVLVIVALVVLGIVGAFVGNNIAQKQIVGQIKADAANALNVDPSTVTVDIGDGFALAKKVKGVVPSVKIETMITKADADTATADKGKAPMRKASFSMSNYSLKDKTIESGCFDTLLPPEQIMRDNALENTQVELTDEGMKIVEVQGDEKAEALVDFEYTIGTDDKGTKAFPAARMVFKSFKLSKGEESREFTSQELRLLSDRIQPTRLVSHLEDKLQVTELHVSKEGVKFSASCISPAPMTEFLQAAQG